MKELLNEELLRQIRLMNFDRSKTLLEQVPDDGLGSKFNSKSMGTLEPEEVSGLVKPYEYNCNKMSDFLNSYPQCCKYPNLADLNVPRLKEVLPWNDNEHFGYCMYKDERGLSLTVPYNAELQFSDQNFILSLVDVITEKLTTNNYELFNKFLLPNLEFQNHYRKYDNDINKRVEAIKNFLDKKIIDIYPPKSIIKIKLKNGINYTSSIDLQTNYTDPLILGNFYDDSGNVYEDASITDRRTDYQKFIDEWGAVVQVVSLIGAAVLAAFTGGATWALVLEIGVELLTGVAIACRDFQKGDNIMGTANLLMGAASALKFTRLMRGFSSLEIKAAGEALANSGLKTTSSIDDYVSFIRNLEKSNPRSAMVIRASAKIDDYTMNELKQNLPELLRKEMIENVREAFIKDPNITKKIPFMKRLWVRDLALQGGIGLTGLLLDLSPIGDKWNDVTKQKFEWVVKKLPEEHRPSFVMNVVNNEALQDPKYIDYVEKVAKNIGEKADPEFFSKVVASISDEKLKKNGKNYNENNISNTEIIPIKVEPVINDEYLSKEGYVKYIEYDGEVDVQTFLTYKGVMYCKPKK